MSIARQATSWLPRVALVALGAALTWPQPSDAGTVTNATRTVAIGGTVRPDGKGGWRVEGNRTHATRGLLRPRCQADGTLRVDLRPRSRVAGWGAVSVDGLLVSQGVTVGVASAQGGRLLLRFARHGERIGCSELTDPAGNAWVSWNQPVGAR